MPDRFLAVCLWLLAWLIVSILFATAWATLRGRANVLSAGVLMTLLAFTAAVLANAGADLW